MALGHTGGKRDLPPIDLPLSNATSCCHPLPQVVTTSQINLYVLPVGTATGPAANTSIAPPPAMVGLSSPLRLLKCDWSSYESRCGVSLGSQCCLSLTVSSPSAVLVTPLLTLASGQSGPWLS